MFQLFVLGETIHLELGEDEISVNAHFEPTTTGGLERRLRNLGGKLIEQSIHRTGGSLAVTSSGAVFNPHGVKHGYPFTKRLRGDAMYRDALLYHTFFPLPPEMPGATFPATGPSGILSSLVGAGDVGWTRLGRLCSE